MADILLDVQNLQGYFETADGPVHALNGVSLSVARGHVAGIVGETGSGKSATVSLVVGLPAASFRLTGGAVLFEGVDLLKLDEAALRRVRGRRISIAFQDPRSSLNPVISIGEQLALVARVHHGLPWPKARRRAVEILAKVQISEPERRARQYAHELSGGMVQRVAIALALMPEPDLLILDEPTTGLDVTVQADIVALLKSTVREEGLTALVISHDIAMVSQLCDDVAVMYDGWVVEQGTARQVLETPSHPYTAALARAATSIDFLQVTGDANYDTLPPPAGCRFAGRCPRRAPDCDVEPPLIEVADGHFSKCHFAARLYSQSSAVMRVASP